MALMENLYQLAKENKVKDTEKFRLIAYNRWGYQCANNLYPNKTKAISEGRNLKRNGYAFSYIVYERYNNESGDIHRKQIAKG